MTEAAQISGSERAAIFLMSLSESEAAEIMRHMPVSDVQKIGQAMATLKNVSRSQADTVLEHFTSSVQTQAPLTGASPQSLKRLLSKSLGEDKASSLLERFTDDKPKGLESLQMMDPKEITEIVLHEHPQVIAIVLAGLDPTKSAQVIAELPRRMSTDIIERIAKMTEIPQEAIMELDNVMQHRFNESSGFKSSEIGGIRNAAEIMNILEKEIEDKVFEELEEKDPPLKQEIQDNMFVFDNLLDADDRGIQALVREVTSEVLIIALKGADEEIQEKIFNNMSKRAAELLRDDLDAKGPVRITDVEEAQKEIVSAARQLVDDGKMMMGSAGNDFV
ncbi:MAG: flagellar motor switch protein FliG [Gammaproteobacteria bacterium]|nr:flagellar motor switch protein FliG [Gammaproteobacteria bacterium]